MKYQFPPTVFSRDNSLSQQLQHITEELHEVQTAFSMESRKRVAEELIDLYHSVETAIRIMERAHGALFVHNRRDEVEEKNRKRGYYL